MTSQVHLRCCASLSNIFARLRAVAAACLLLAIPVQADDWSHWRGSDRNDRSSEESGWEKGVWPLKNPIWETDVGDGGTSPLIVKGRVYVMGHKDPDDRVYCLDAATGRELWSVAYRCPTHALRSTGDEGLYSGPTSTPEFDADTDCLYTLSCDGDLQCRDTQQDGKIVWSLNLYQDYQIPQRPKFGRQGRRDYGYTTAPLLSGDLVIVEVGDDEGHLMAFDKKSGKRVWASEYKGPAGHSGGIVPIEVEGVPCVAALGYEGLHVARIDAQKAGRTVALYPWGTDFAKNVATPCVSGSDILITAAYNHNSICRLHITLDGAAKVWEQPYASKICSPIIERGNIYWAWHQLHCLDFATGQQLWEGGEFGDAGSCIATSDQRLIIWGGHGRLALAEMADRSPGKYSELARTDRVFASEVWPHVALSDARLYCKDRMGKLKCFSIDPRTRASTGTLSASP